MTLLIYYIYFLEYLKFYTLLFGTQTYSYRLQSLTIHIDIAQESQTYEKMNKSSHSAIVSLVIPTALTLVSGNSFESQTIRIDSRLQPDPLIINGKSGGNQQSNCGFVAAKPNQVIQIAESLPYLRLTVEGTGKPTLLIDGPGGRFCVLADNYSGGKPEISGYWNPGQYSLHVGDIYQGQYTYTLSISQQKTSK